MRLSVPPPKRTISSSNCESGGWVYWGPQVAPVPSTRWWGASKSQPPSIMNNPATHQAQQVILPLGYPGLNDLLQMTAQHWTKRSREKKKWEAVIALHVKKAKTKPTTGPVHLSFRYVPPNRRRDPDNTSAVVRKYALDALQQIGIIEQDNWSGILGLYDEYAEPDKSNPHIVMTIRGSLK